MSSTARIAITGLACRYPGVEGTAALAARWDADAPLPAEGLLPPDASYADFGIPPIYRASINRVQLDVLALSRDALAQAGLGAGAVDAERTDVLFCTALAMNRNIENHARIQGLRLAGACADALPASDREGLLAEARRQLDREFGATSHDKVGEMASTVAARVSACFKLRGRALALEAGDLGGAQALLAARDALAQGRADAVLVVGAQRIESFFGTAVLEALAGAQTARDWREAACAVVLQRAPLDASRVLGWLDDIRLTHPPPPQGWRSWALEGAEDAKRTWVLGGLLQQAPPDLCAADELLRTGRQACGYGYAVEALSTLAQAVLACRIPADAAQAVALVRGAQGSTCAIRVGAAASPGRAIGRSDSSSNATHAGIGIAACGARFGVTRGLDGYWDALRSGAAYFRPLTGPRFDPEHCRTPSDNPGLGYYIDHASFADVEAEDAAATLALDAAREAAQRSRAPAIGTWTAALGPALAVVATNLTTDDERRGAAHTLSPRIEAAIAAAMDAVHLPPQRRARVHQVLREAERVAGTMQPMSDRAARMAASDLGRRVASCFGVTDVHSVALESACASSLAAMEVAVNALRSGRCGLAFVIGVELPVNVHDLSLCSTQRMLSPDVIATFTDQATGFTPGDGAGVLMLVRTEDARRLRLPLLAQIRAIGSSTESKSVVAPNEAGQVRSMQRAFEQVEFGPEAVDFVETHGTGTLIGDEVEINSLALAYGDVPRACPLHLGALKTQFGHCFAAAGMASMVKTLLALAHEELPPNHFDHPLKASLRLSERGFDALEHPCPWPARSDRPRRAAINAFGTGGINVHLLLEEVGGA